MPRTLTFAGALAALGLLVACGDNQAGPDAAPAAPDAAPLPVDAGADAGIDAPPGALAPCLARPTDLPRPPTGQLPCELLPPGFKP